MKLIILIIYTISFSIGLASIIIKQKCSDAVTVVLPADHLINDKMQFIANLKVAAEFWDFLGGEGSYTQLLNIFEKVGVELRSEIDEYFSRYNKD